jgi:glucose-1-phosphate thymidylyltransferase
MKQAVILAAGEGRRLRPFTVSKPKAMLYIAGKPTLQYIVESLAHNGIRDLVLVVGYRREHIFDYMGSGEQFGVKIKYINQKNQLGTADALFQVKMAVDDEFIVLPGDKLIEPDTIAQLKDAAPEAMIVKKIENPVRSSVIKVDERGVVKEAMRSERRVIGPSREPGTFMVNTGIYIFTKEILDFIEGEQSIPVALNKMIVKGKEIKALETKGTWLDITYPWDILDLNTNVLRRIEVNIGGTTEANVSIKGNVSLGEKTVIRPNSSIFGPVVVGRGCEIGPNVCIMPSTSIGDNVTISPFTQVKNSVIGSDVSIGPGSIIQDSVIDKDCVVEGHFAAMSGDAEIKIDEELCNVKAGTMMGEGCRLGSHIVAQPGVIIGNYAQIKSLNTISGQLPDKSLVI